MSLNISSEVSLKFSGKDAFSFVDSLISNSISESEIKFSYLLGPDGKVMFWFICSLNSQEFQMYQSLDVLEKMMEVFNKYKIRIDCDIEISKEVSKLSSKVKDEVVKIKLDEVSKAIVPLTKKERITDNHLVNLMQYYDLVNELKSL